MNSLRELSDNLLIKLNKIRLLIGDLQYRDKIFILLEGKTDINLFRNIFDNQLTYITQLNGKTKIIQALEILQNENYKNILGIKDSDFDNLENITYSDINLFITDFADMEIEMIESEAFESIINEFAHENYHQSFLQNLKIRLFQEATIMGYLRWYNERYFSTHNRYILRFEGLNFNRFIEINRCDISINIENFFTTIITHSSISLNKENLQQEIENLKQISTNHLQICNGHDITTLIAYLLRNRECSNKTNMNKDKIEEALRLSYSFDYFKNTKLYRELIQWQNNNKQIFKEY